MGVQVSRRAQKWLCRYGAIDVPRLRGRSMSIIGATIKSVSMQLKIDMQELHRVQQEKK
jgi:hypothetical protein